MTEGSALRTVGWQPAIIVVIETLTPAVTRVVLRPQRWQTFLPGQHIDVKLTAPDGYSARRSYSLTSAPESVGTFEIAIERLDDGEVSPYFHDIAEVGDAIEISGPHAEHFVWRAEQNASLLMLAGGSGVAPFMSMVRHRAFVAHNAPVTLLYSARSWESVIYREELIAQESRLSDFCCVFTLTRDMARRPQDFSRRVDAAMIASLITVDSLPSQSLVCGSNAFVRTTSDLLLDIGIPASSILTERYGGG